MEWVTSQKSSSPVPGTREMPISAHCSHINWYSPRPLVCHQDPISYLVLYHIDILEEQFMMQAPGPCQPFLVPMWYVSVAWAVSIALAGDLSLWMGMTGKFTYHLGTSSAPGESVRSTLQSPLCPLHPKEALQVFRGFLGFLAPWL